MKLKDIINLFYSTIELVDLTTNSVIKTVTPSYKMLLQKWFDKPVYAIIAHKNKIIIITEGEEHEN